MHPVLGQVPLPRLEPRCTPEQVAYARLLSLDGAAFESAVAAELDANPALDRQDAACPLCGGVVRGPCCAPARRRGDGGDLPARSTGSCELVPAAPTLAEALLRDLAPLVPGADLPVARYVLAALDGHGLLDGTPAQAARALGVDVRRVEGVIGALREVTCPGAAASSLREHLLLDLAALDDTPPVRLARALVGEAADALARGGAAAAARALGRSRDEVAAACDFLRSHLHPYPVLDAGRDHAAPVVYTVPDVVLSADGGVLAARVVEADRVLLRVDERFDRLARASEAASGAVRAREAVDRARLFLDRVARRWWTMRAVAEAVAAHQSDFVLSGGPMRPLTRSALAERLGLHESTVGRAVRDRSVRLPSGRTVPFALFFATAPGVREELAAIVAGEDRPLTDAELALELERRGHRVARRTVVKYRAQLDIARAADRG
ncbi:hypothetical protein [Nocardiopsis sp. NRRL B-16309]|uniref:RNA polymerase factor sigma-54 n=1 Tax=Nocardiopsis sp. NRRL B-16309 TaxID=1519494 RepID=UPI0006ADA170|nr:hypothetical protein [Nocardiopsis sp. NRRL B-16309]KOX07867.1 hypothetical protein ADL05_28135 [Nocardiopsis sp. NRRL B-16309]